MEVPHRSWSIDRLEKDDGRIRLAASFVNRRDLATPFFFFEESELERNLAYFREYLPRVQLYYAVKANPHPLLIEYFLREGLSLDVASAQEIELVMKLGAAGDGIILTNPNKQQQCVAALFDHSISAFAYDTVDEVKKVVGYAKRHGCATIPKALLRIRIESKDVQIDLNKKFGCSLEDAADLVKAAYDLGVETVGLAFHVGTQSYMGHNYVVGIKSAILVARAVKEQYGITMNVIDIGGGFPDQNIVEHSGVTYSDLFREISAICDFAEREGFSLYAEPGRILVSAAGTLVTNVIGISERADRRSVYIDDGVFGCYNGKYFDYKHFGFYSVMGPDRDAPFSRQLVPHTVWGPTCDSIDLIEDEVLLPADLQVGDYICSCEMGAYSLASASNYNGFHLRAAQFVPSLSPATVQEFASHSLRSRRPLQRRKALRALS